MRIILGIVIFAIICIFVLAGCSGAAKTQKYSGLTAQSAFEKCDAPSEYYDINSGAYGMRATVVRHPKCLGIADVLVVVWQGDRTERHDTAAKLLMLLYVDHLNTNRQPETPVKGHYLKTDQHTADSETTHAAFFQLRPKVTTK